jgi:hypothetical protein
LGVKNAEYVSRHPWKKEFEKRYGTEWELFEQVKKHAEDLRQMRKSVLGR